MPITTSADNIVPLGTPCPDFSLTRVDTNERVTRDELAGVPNFKGLVVMFICNHCPVVGHIRYDTSFCGASCGDC